MTGKEKYREFCKVEKEIPIFSKDWWLDSVCGENNWDVILFEKNGKIWGSIPYCKKKILWFDTISMPELTQTLGPYIKYPANQRYYKKLSWEKDIMNEFIEQLPKFDMFSQNFHHSITNWLPFYWKGFTQTTRYTYVIDDLSCLDKVYDDFNSSAKKNIKKARNNDIKVIDSLDINAFYKINEITFKKQGLKIPYSFDSLKKLFEEISNHNSCIMKFAVRESKILSVMLAVYDSTSIYMFIGSSNRNIKTFGAEYLLYFEMMKYASEKGLRFDFEGSMIEGVEQRNKSFGAIQKPYFNITKTNSKLLKIRKLIKDIAK